MSPIVLLLCVFAVSAKNVRNYGGTYHYVDTVSTAQDKLQKLEDDYTHQEGRVQALEHDNTAVSTKIEAQKADIAALQVDLKKLQDAVHKREHDSNADATRVATEINGVQTLLSDLASNIAKVTNDINTLKTHGIGQITDTNSLESKYNNLKKHVDQLNQASIAYVDRLFGKLKKVADAKLH